MARYPRADLAARVLRKAKPADFGARFGRGWVARVRTERGASREIAILADSWTCGEPKHRGLTPRSVRERMEAYQAEDTDAHGAEIAARVAAFQAADPAPAWRVEIEAARIAREVGAWALYLARFLAAVDTGYAITCHAAQGSQYAEVMVVADVVDFLADGDPEQVYRWSYTALTRAVKSALVVRKSRGGW